jgi:multidrug resistance efflux pump
MPEIDTKLAELETESLETHVAVAHERFKNLDTSINRLEGLIEKNAAETKEGLSELKKIIVWASSTLFATMLLALLTSVFGGLN